MRSQAESPCVSRAEDLLIEISGRGRRRRFRLTRVRLIAGGALLAIVGAASLVAPFYLILRDTLLAGLLERQARMQYDYEARISTLRLRLDELARRRLVDQEGVEVRLRTLAARQARLETRAAVIAGLEAALPGAVGQVTPRPARAEESPQLQPLRPASGQSLGAKPAPQGFELRLGADGPPATTALARAPNLREARGPSEGSFAPAPLLVQASDPAAAVSMRIQSLALSLDRVEREQTHRISGIVPPALAATRRLREAFDVAGLPAARYLPPPTGAATGGPFIAAPDGKLDTSLAAAQSAIAALKGLSEALPRAPLRAPLSGDPPITSGFGYRADPFLGRPALHGGVDFRDDFGAPVKATAAGVITAAGPQGGYGNLVEVDHGDGVSTRYGHLSALAVSPGQKVKPGDVIGRVGSTGRSTGPHLHYEVRLDGEAVDPVRFLRAAAILDQDR